jgi:ABC-type uncharacterized transport system fused permease/ATPase subunit
LPDKTREVEYKQEEYEYFTQQIYNEFRRVTMGDYAQAREVFVDMGEQMSRFIYNMNMSWDKFLAFYSDLNNARKEQDDEYERE